MATRSLKGTISNLSFSTALCVQFITGLLGDVVQRKWCDITGGVSMLRYIHSVSCWDQEVSDHMTSHDTM